MRYVEIALIPAADAAAYRAVGWTIGASSTPGYVSAWRVVKAETSA